MKITLTDELRAAVNQSPDGVEVEDEVTQQVYVIIDAEAHRRAMQALQQQQIHAAIQQGISDMEAGRGMPVEEADTHLREKLGFPPRKVT